MKKNFKDGVVIGLALFATFFGAGNLIFPPLLGLQSGTDWLKGIIGFVASGVVLPISAVYAISYAGGSVEAMTDKLHPKFSDIMLLIIMLFAGFIAVPRTGAVGYELGMLAMVKGIPSAVFIIIYFALTYYFVNDKNNVINKVGSILTPALVIILIFIIVKGAVTPIAKPIDTEIGSAFVNAFLGGYQTGDLFVSFMVGGVFIGDIVRKGYNSDKERNKMVAFAGCLAFVLLFIIYAGLLYQGATVSGIYPKDIDRSELLLSIVNSLLGRAGLFALGIAVVLACLTTAIGIVTAIAQFFDTFTKGKLSYKKSALLFCIIGAAIALLGVDRIVFISTPVFLGLYPTCIVLAFAGLFHKYIPNTASYKCGVFFTLVVSLIEAFNSVVNIPFLSAIIGAIPLSEYGFGWVLPAVAGFIAGAVIGKMKESNKEIITIKQ